MNTSHLSVSIKKKSGLSTLGTILLVVLIALALGFGYRKYAANKAQTGAAAAQIEVQEAQKRLLAFSTRWDDASRLASSTGRIALSGPVASLQHLQRESSEIPVPKCLEEGRKYLSEAIALEVESFLAFMSDTATSGKIRAIELKTESRRRSTDFIRVGLNPEACASYISAAKN